VVVIQPVKHLGARVYTCMMLSIFDSGKYTNTPISEVKNRVQTCAYEPECATFFGTCLGCTFLSSSAQKHHRQNIKLQDPKPTRKS